jgi:uncharacterized protein YdbL (DUF1318 family)
MLRNKVLAGVFAVELMPALAALATIAATPAMAQTAAEKTAVDGAKARGQVGEQGDGYLGFVTPSTDPGLAAAVAAINAGRMQVYRDTAMKTGVTVEAAGQATAQQLFMRLPPGQFFKPLNGDWTKKT